MNLLQHNLWKTSLHVLLLLIGMAILFWLGWTARDEFIHVLGSVKLGYFVTTVLIGVAFMLAQSWLFTILLAKQKGDINTWVVVAAFFISQPSKYIPGRIWPAVIQSLTLDRSHIIGSVAAVNIELILVGVVHMVSLGGTALFFDHIPVALMLIAAGVLLAAWVVRIPSGDLLSRLPTRLAQSLWISSTGTARNLPTNSGALGISILLIGLNILSSLGVLVSAGDTVHPEQYAGILAVFYLGFAASFLALPVPAGLGVREAATVALGLVLAPEIDSATLISVALLARCWQLCTDLICLGFGAAILALGPTKHRR